MRRAEEQPMRAPLYVHCTYSLPSLSTLYSNTTARNGLLSFSYHRLRRNSGLRPLTTWDRWTETLQNSDSCIIMYCKLSGPRERRESNCLSNMSICIPMASLISISSLCPLTDGSMLVSKRSTPRDPVLGGESQTPSDFMGIDLCPTSHFQGDGYATSLYTWEA